MATKEFPLVPATVPTVETRFRSIKTQIPAPESIELLEKMRRLEPRSMGGQPPIIWHHGEGVTVSDAYGNRWLDFSSGVLVTSSGHANPDIVEAIAGMARQGLYHAYCFPTEIRLRLVEKIQAMLPAPLARVFLLTTGSEAVECCIKLARTKGQQIAPNKNIIVSFSADFHGRTLGSQLAGGSPALKSWIGDLDGRFVQVPFPDGFRQQDTSFAVFEKALADQGVNPAQVCGVIGETFQGCNATLFPTDYAQALRRWCDKNQAVLMFDEIQAGFGRTGKLFGFQHMDVVPDLVACGKGMSGGMPVSAVLGTDELMNLYGPGEMTSTHSANTVCSAAALANIELMEREDLIGNVARLAPVLAEGAERISRATRGLVGRCVSVGFVSAIQFTRPGTTDPEPDMAWQFVKRAYERGVLLFAPVGIGGGAIKLCPPLIADEAALREGLEVLEAIAEELGAEFGSAAPATAAVKS